MRHLIAIHIQKLKKKYTTQNYNTINAKQGLKIIKGLKDKINNNNLVITKAEKGYTVVIIHKNDYDSKIGEFMSNNEFTEKNIDPTKQYHKTIRNTVNKCSIIVPKDKKWQINCLNPKSPQIKGSIKLHKVDNPIRPVINFRYAPAYKVAQFLQSFSTTCLIYHICLIYTIP